MFQVNILTRRFRVLVWMLFIKLSLHPITLRQYSVEKNYKYKSVDTFPNVFLIIFNIQTPKGNGKKRYILNIMVPLVTNMGTNLDNFLFQIKFTN